MDVRLIRHLLLFFYSLQGKQMDVRLIRHLLLSFYSLQGKQMDVRLIRHLLLFFGAEILLARFFEENFGFKIGEFALKFRFPLLTILLVNVFTSY